MSMKYGIPHSELNSYRPANYDVRIEIGIELSIHFTCTMTTLLDNVTIVLVSVEKHKRVEIETIHSTRLFMFKYELYLNCSLLAQ